MKKCVTCLIELPLENFSNRYKKKIVKQSSCKDCQKKYKDKYYARNKESAIQSAKINQKLLELEIQSYKNVPCKDCGKSYPYYVMDFDHLGPKLFSISKGSRQHSYLELLLEIKKCEVVCANCHRIRTLIEVSLYCLIVRTAAFQAAGARCDSG